MKIILRKSTLKIVSCGCLLMLLLFALIAFVFGMFYGWRNYVVAGSSMSPTLNDGTLFIADTRKEPARGDIVVYQSGRYNLIHRVVAMPGDEVRFSDDKLFVNDVEDSGNGKTTLLSYSIFESGSTYKVPSGQYLLLGDNRGNSRDSRSEGFVPRSDIKGVYLFSYLPK